jgi:hypothetical protein
MLDKAQDALDRMRRAHQRGTGCHLTAEMIQELSVTVVGAMWGQPRPAPKTIAPDDLRPWGYAPGHYAFACCDCPTVGYADAHYGAKRSWRCEDHAREARKREGV